MAAALAHAAANLQRLPGREERKGLHEVNEPGPTLRTALQGIFPSGAHAKLRHRHAISDWTREDTEVDLVVLDDSGEVELSAQLKVWDIGHQLFDLAKIACLLATRVRSGFLVCVGQRVADFARKPGVLFPERAGTTREHSFRQLIDTYAFEWRHHVGGGRPEPTAVPTAVMTTAVAAGIPIAAYPGHSARAVEVRISDPTPVPLHDGWPV